VTNAFLRSGKLDHYLPMGENGQAVYLSALQLRETLRLRGKNAIANCLAIPQPNESGNRIDWYAPLEGHVIPWSAATEEERTLAYQMLEENQAQLTKISQSMLNMPNKDHQLFGALLGKAIQFPDKEHIYIVNGQPVVTFWGFVSTEHNARIDPVACLKSPIATTPVKEPAVVPIAPVVAVKPWWRFLWWLIPLLLLLLAAFFLRGCFTEAPTVVAPLIEEKKPVEAKPAIEPVKPVDDNDKDKDKAIVDKNDPRYHVTTSHSGVITDKVDANGQLITPDSTVIGTEGNVVVPEETIDNSTAGNHVGDAMNGNIPPVQPEITTPEANGSETNTAVGTENGTNPTQALPDPTGSAIHDQNTNNQAGTTLSNNTASSNNTALTIPPEALQNGSVQFLDGRWKAGAGIQDQKTGKPLSLNYQISNGKGEVVMTRSDGVVCKAPITSGVKNGELNIDSRSQALCSDGSNYRMPNIVCQLGATSVADCQGQYDRNQKFPMSIKRESK